MKFIYDCTAEEASFLAFIIRSLIKKPIITTLILAESNFLDKDDSFIFRQFMQEIHTVFEKSIKSTDNATRKRIREVCSLPDNKTRTIGPKVKAAFILALDFWESSRCA